LPVSEVRIVTFCENIQAEAEFLCSDSRLYMMLRNVQHRRKIDFYQNMAHSRIENEMPAREGAKNPGRVSNILTFDYFTPVRQSHISDASWCALSEK
jgi:hypothetical protein